MTGDYTLIWIFLAVGLLVGFVIGFLVGSQNTRRKIEEEQKRRKREEELNAQKLSNLSQPSPDPFVSSKSDEPPKP